MGMKELLQLHDQQAWENFLKGAYEKVKKDHSGGKWSWAKTRLRSGHKRETAVNTAGQVATFGGAAASAAGVAGVAALATGTGGFLVVALPAGIALGTLGYWGYKKSEHHQVNKEIWAYFVGHRDPQNLVKLLPDASKNATPDDVKKWLGWFGDEGVGNMNHLQEKLSEAKTKFDNNFKTLESTRNALFQRIQVWSIPQSFPQNKEQYKQAREQQKQVLMRDADDLANKYMALAQDLQYVWYRLERTFMYYEMLALTVKRLREEMESKLASIEDEATKFCERNMEAYETLWKGLSDCAYFLK